MGGGLLISTVLALLSGSAAASSPLDERWTEQVLPLRKGTFEVGLGAGSSVILTPIGTFVQVALDPTPSLRLGVQEWLEVSPAWLRARVTPWSDGGGILLGAGVLGVGVLSGTALGASVRLSFFPTIMVEGYLKSASLVVVLKLSVGMTLGLSGGLAFTRDPVQTTGLTLLYRLTERWVMLSTFSMSVGARGPAGELVALPSLLVRSRSHLTPTWAIDLWLHANDVSFAPGLSVVFAPSGLF